MTKQRRNVPNPGFYKVSGSSVEDRDIARQAKGALGREAARRRTRAGLKTKLGEAPPEQHAAELPGKAPRPRAQKPAAPRSETAAARPATTATKPATAAQKAATPKTTPPRKPRPTEPATRTEREHDVSVEVMVKPAGRMRRAAQRLLHLAELPVERARDRIEAPGGGPVRRATRGLLHAAEEAVSFGRAMAEYWRHREE